jgi:hypothetical protein
MDDSNYTVTPFLVPDISIEIGERVLSSSQT